MSDRGEGAGGVRCGEREVKGCRMSMRAVHRLTGSLAQQLTGSPAHQLTGLSTYRFIDLPAYRASWTSDRLPRQAQGGGEGGGGGNLP